MDSYINQDDKLRDFLAENGKAIALGLVIGLAAVVAWHFWQKHQTGQAQTVSAQYQRLSEAATDKNSSELADFAKQNVNSYGAFAAMSLAKQAVDKKQYSQAIQWLTTATEQTKDENLLSLIRLRLARVQLQAKQADAALATLALVKAPSWQAMVSNLRGDAWLAKGDNQQARTAYQAGLTTDASPALFNLMKMKLNDLAG